MKVKLLELSDFRNYQNLQIDFAEDANLLFGDNAQGKTNILEAIYLCGTTKSHRGSKDKDMIRFDGEEAHIRMFIERDDISHKIDMHLKQNKAKGIAIDGIPIKKSSELFSLINIVSFSPEDLSIVKNGPGERRRFMDMELCQLDKIYLFHLTNYNKAINQRNALLKQLQYSKGLEDTLTVWNEQLLSSGTKLIESRNEFIREISKIAGKIHEKLSDGREVLKLIYEPNIEVNDYKKAMKESIQKDIATKMTNVGPHRDDICFQICKTDEKMKTEKEAYEDVRRFGSQGQQRTAALSLKLAEIELVKERIKDTPIILLDDVLSELDRNRQEQLLSCIQGMQTIITCTGLEEFVNNRLKHNRVYHVSNGEVIQLKEDMNL